MRTSCEILGEIVRVTRRRRRLTQGELAKLAGVGTAFLYQLETGKPTVRMDKVLDVLIAAAGLFDPVSAPPGSTRRGQS